MSVAPARPSHARVPPWRNVRVLRIVAQIAVLAVVGLLGLWLWDNLTTGMARSNLTFSLDFLNSTAGFEIAETPIPYTATDTYGRALLVGLANTLIVSFAGIVLATLLGIVVGVARLSNNWLINRIAAGYVEVIRNTPLLVQLFLIYAVLTQLPSVANSIELPGSIFLNQRGLFLPRPYPQPSFAIWLVILIGAVAVAVVARVTAARRATSGRPTSSVRLIGLVVLLTAPVVGWFALGGPVAIDVPVRERFNFIGGVVLSPELTALLAGLVLYTAAFIGEVVRGGIQAVRRGQTEAAQAIGLTDMQTLRLVVFPQALRIIVPPLTSQYLNLAKNSSLAIAIGFSDLFQVSTTMANQTGQPVSVIVLVMATYLAISLVTSLFLNLYNRRVQIVER